MSQKIDTSISPAVDPACCDAIADEFITGMNEAGPVRHAAFTATRAAMDTLFTTSHALADAERNIRTAGLNDPQTADRLRRAATAKMAAARKSASDALANLQCHVDQINAGIDDAFGLPTARVDVCEAGRCADVRAYLRTLPKGERADAIRKAMEDRDVAVVAAVLSASPLASGIDRKTAEFVRTDAERAFAPDAVRLRANIGRLVSVLETAMDSTEKRFAPLTGTGESPAARAARSLAALEGGAS
jgi:hypothetical protein